ncbi:MAG TPA: hypothetical protein VFZ69_07320 [Longimicrobiales bacterium]
MRLPSVVVLVAVALVPGTAFAQSADAKIREAMSAAPASISAQATILDWPATEGGDPVVLRQGSNGWTCLPDLPVTDGSDPQCLDETWIGFIQAYLKKETPRLARVGIGYMMAPGGAHNSNTDPYATGRTPDNDWGHDPPHLMLVVPDASALAGIPTKRENGGPWVMWAGTPYVHLMIPLEPVRMK